MNISTELILAITLTPYLLIIGSTIIEVVEVKFSVKKQEIINITDYTIK